MQGAITRPIQRKNQRIYNLFYHVATYSYFMKSLFLFCIFIPLQAQFKDTLFNLWFNRGNITTENPTAFQKIFVGEIVRNPYKLSVRNWIQFAMLESRRLNYYGYMHYYPYDVGFPINAFIKAHTSILLLVPIMCRNKKSACYVIMYWFCCSTMFTFAWYCSINEIMPLLREPGQRMWRECFLDWFCLC